MCSSHVVVHSHWLLRHVIVHPWGLHAETDPSSGNSWLSKNLHCNNTHGDLRSLSTIRPEWSLFYHSLFISSQLPILRLARRWYLLVRGPQIPVQLPVSARHRFSALFCRPYMRNSTTAQTSKPISSEIWVSRTVEKQRPMSLKQTRQQNLDWLKPP